MIKRVKRFLLSLAIGILSLFGATACIKPVEASIVLVDEFYREECILNQEFDVTTIVENYNKNWTYNIEECFYIDNLDGLKRYAIEVVDNVKFTQNVAYDVHVTLTATAGSSVAESTFIVKVVVPTDDMQQTMIQSWSEVGVSKRIEGSRSYVLEGEETSVKVNYLGENQAQVNNGVNIGYFLCDTKEASLTSWDNAVVTFWVYNPQEYDMQIGYLALKGKTKYKEIGHNYARKDLPAGEWTQVNWSMREIGFDYNFLSDYLLNFKVRIRDASGMSAPYQWTLYFCKMDIADYSLEAFPDLETRTEAEIWADASGDEEDKWLCDNYTKDTTNIQTVYYTDLTARVKEYTAEETAPIEDSTSYIEYKMKASYANSGQYAGNFLRFDSTRPISESLYEQYKDMNWNNAYLTFWAYNDLEVGTCNLVGMNGNDMGSLITTLPYGEWTKVEVSLRNYCSIFNDPFAVRPDDPLYTYNLRLFVRYTNTECHTMETYRNFASRLLIDGVTFESRYVGENMWLTEHYTDSSSKINRYFVAPLSATELKFGTVTAPESGLGESYIEYNVSAGVGHSGGSYEANFLNFSAYTETKNTRYTRPMSAESYEKYKNIDWTDAYVSFWMYNDADVEVTLYGIRTEGVDYEQSNQEGWDPTKALMRLAPKTWTKVTVSLAHACGVKSDVIATGNYNIKLWLVFNDPEASKNKGTYDGTESWKFYMAGFKFENVSLEAKLVNSYTPDSSQINRFFTGSLTTSVKEFDANVVAPTGTSYGTYIHYTVKGKNSQGNLSANFLNFSNFTETKNTRVTCPMPAPLYEEYKTLDWANAYVSFWMYNGTTVEAKVRGTQKSAGVNYSSGTSESLGNENDFFEMLNAGEWTKVTAKLSDICEITNESFLSNNYNLKFWLSFTDSNYKNVEGTWDFYLTGFEIYTVSAEEQADLANTAMNNALLSNYTADSSKINKYYPTKLTASVEEFDTNFAAPTGTSYSTYVNYVATGTNSSGGLFVNFINFSNITDTTTLNTRAKLPMSDSLYNQCASLDWENAFISFWIYNGAAADIELYGTQPFEGVNYGDSASEARSRTAIQSLNAGEWTKVTVKLSDICEVTNEGFAAKNYNLKLWLSGTNTAFVGNSSNFYLTGFEFVSGTVSA